MTKKKDIRSTSNAAIYHIRLQVVDYLRSKKGTQQECASILGVSLRFVSKIWRIYKAGGKKALVLKRRGVKKHTKGLSKKQVIEIKKSIIQATPDHYGIPYFLWVSDAVKILIKKQTGYVFSSRHVRRLLYEWGFTAQKPIYKAYEQNPKLVKQWIENEYEKIKQKAKEQNGIIYWEDETGMRSDHQAGKSYAPIGKTPVIRRTGQRFSLNMISAISNKGKLCFKILDGTFNTDVFIDFLTQLIKQNHQKVFLIADGHPAHKTKKLSAWLLQNKNKIALYIMPP